MAECAAVCEHTHLPLQSGSTRILKAMRRTYGRERYLRLVDELRAAIPDLALTTDVIVGFPGETERGLRGDARGRRGGRATTARSRSSTRRGREPRRRRCPIRSRRRSSGSGSSGSSRSSSASPQERNRERIGRVEEVLVEGPSRTDPTLLRGRTRRNTTVNFAGTTRAGRARRRQDRGRDLDHPPGHATGRRCCVVATSPGTAAQRPRPRRAPDRGRRRDPLRRDRPRRQRPPADGRGLAGARRLRHHDDHRPAEDEELAEDPPAELPVEVVHVPFMESDERDWEEIESEIEAAVSAAPDVATATRDVYLIFLEHFRKNVAAGIRAVARGARGRRRRPLRRRQGPNGPSRRVAAPRSPASTRARSPPTTPSAKSACGRGTRPGSRTPRATRSGSDCSGSRDAGGVDGGRLRGARAPATAASRATSARAGVSATTTLERARARLRD